MPTTFLLALIVLAAVPFLIAGCAATGPAPRPSGSITDLVRAAVGTEHEFSLVVSISVPESHREAFLPVARRAEEGTHREPGNLTYTFLADPNQPGSYLLYERWRNLTALEEHLAQPYIADLFEFVASSQAQVSVQVLDPLF